MKSIEYLTALVLGQRSLNQKLGKEVVLWADLLLAQGIETTEVKALICLDASASQAQIEKAVDDCLTQLKIPILDEKPAHLLLIWAWTQKLLKSETGADDFLDQMQRLCVEFGHEPVYMPFYLLACAKKELSDGKPSIVFHDRELNEHNFEQVLRWEVELFVDQQETEILNWIRISK